MRQISFIVEVLVIIIHLKPIHGSIFCSDKYCQSYREQRGCPVLSIGCQIQNETHNGELFPSSEPCNCCNICLENIREGEYCTVGTADTAPPLFVCGPGLYCTPDGNDGDYRCRSMTDTPCFKERIEFDRKQEANETGSFMERPKCNGDGNFWPIKCNPGQNCFCVDEDDGSRIFGESAHSLYTEMTMKCECSRLNRKLSKLLPSRFPAVTVRCLEDGSYDPMQCMGDMCMCVDRNLGFSDSDTFNVTEMGFKYLPCYNKTIHRSWTYLHNCELIQHEHIEEIQRSEADGYTVINFKGQKCQSDGWYPPVQSNSTHKYCVDKYGRLLGGYVVPKKSGKDMNCLCARTEEILSRDVTSTKPECCPNGNFIAIQCRKGICYCVDKDGFQTTKEVVESEMYKLTCYNNAKKCI